MKKCKTTDCYSESTSHDGYCAKCCDGRSYPRLDYSDGPQVRRYPAPFGAMGVEEIEVLYGNVTDPKLAHSASRWPCYDSSIGGNGAGVEHKICTKCCRLETEAIAVVNRARLLGCRIDRTCGLHVHLDMRNVERPRVKQFVYWLHNTQEQWQKLIPPSRWNSYYCRELTFCNELPEYLCLSDYSDHFRWFNYSGHKGSIEFRLHPATLNPHKMKGWLRFLDNLGHYVRNSLTFPEKIEDTCMDAFGRDYILARKRNNGVLRLQDVN